MNEATNWLQIAYQYGLGGLLFLITLVLVFKSGGADLQHPDDRWMLKVLIGGYLGYLLVHSLWAYLARF